MKNLKIVVVALVVVCISNLATAGGHGPGCCCLCGKKVCSLEVSEGTAEVTRFEVESKEICIPGICLPWNKCGKRTCGEVRTVCVLKEEKVEKKVCVYDWSIKTICTTCCRHHGIRHGRKQVQKDPRVPFEYYALDRQPVVKAGAPLQGVEALPQGRPVETVGIPVASASAKSPALLAESASTRSEAKAPRPEMKPSPVFRFGGK